MSEQAPPDNLDLEDSVLGAVILSPERLDTVREHVNSTAFASLPHRYTFAAIESLRDQGRPIDILILKEELDRRGHLEDVGGQSFISDLTSRVPTSVNVVYYARILEEKYKRRQLSEYGTAVHNAANNGMEDADVVAAGPRAAGRHPQLQDPYAPLRGPLDVARCRSKTSILGIQ